MSLASEPNRASIAAHLPGWLLSLYVPVLLKAMCAGMFVVVGPFLVNKLGGGPFYKGAIGATWIGSYVIALLAYGGRVDGLDPRNLVRIGLSTMALMFLIMAQAESLPVLFAATSGFGLISGLFWPPIMGWLSTGYEGQRLSRRLSKFNLSWSTGMAVGPALGGFLFELDIVEASHLIPLYLAACLLMLGVLVITLMPSPERDATTGVPVSSGPPPEDVDAARSDLFRPMARIAHFFAYVGNGVYRYQLPSLAIALGITADEFGRVGTTLSLAMFVSFLVLGKTERWHYRLDLFIGAQIVIALNLLALLVVQTWWHMMICMAIGGLAVGVTYSSDLFYGISGGVRRSRRMAIHELLLAIGIASGALFGGAVSEHLGLRLVYPICSGLILCGVVVQLTTYAARRRAIMSVPSTS